MVAEGIFEACFGLGRGGLRNGVDRRQNTVVDEEERVGVSECVGYFKFGVDRLGEALQTGIEFARCYAEFKHSLDFVNEVDTQRVGQVALGDSLLFVKLGFAE